MPPLPAGAGPWPWPQASQPVLQQALVQQALVQQFFFLQPPKRMFNRPPRFFLQQPVEQHFDSQQAEAAQQLGSQQPLPQPLLQQAEAAQQLGSQQPLPQPLLQQAEAAQQLGSQQPLPQPLSQQALVQQLLLQHFLRLNMPFRPANRSQRFLQHCCWQQLWAQQLGSQQASAQQLGSQQPLPQPLLQQAEAAQQLGSQQPLPQPLLQQAGAQQLGSQQFTAQQLGSQQPRLWLASIIRLSSSKAMPWLHIPMLTTIAPNIFHFIAQRLLSMEPGSDASPTNTGDGRAGISKVASPSWQGFGWAQRVNRRTGFVGSNLSSVGLKARPVEPPRLELNSDFLALPCRAIESTFDTYGIDQQTEGA